MQRQKMEDGIHYHYPLNLGMTIRQHRRGRRSQRFATFRISCDAIIVEPTEDVTRPRWRMAFIKFGIVMTIRQHRRAIRPDVIIQFLHALEFYRPRKMRRKYNIGAIHY